MTSDNQAPQVTAADVYGLRLKVGRVLRGPALTAAVFLREVPFMLIDGFGSLRGAPSWVVVEERDGGAKVFSVSAGRAYGAGEQILHSMRADALVLGPEAFVARWAK